MGVLNKIGKGMTIVGLIGGLYTCNCTVPKPLLEEGDNTQQALMRKRRIIRRKSKND